MLIPIWIEFLGSFDNQARSNVISWLEFSGIYARDMNGADEAESGIIVFQTIDDDLLSILRHKSRTTAVIALKIGPGALPHGKLWSMIHAGAFDVLQWPSLPESAALYFRHACRCRARL